MEFRKNKAVTVEGFDEVRSTPEELSQRSPAVKRMLRKHKADAQFKGRAKISMLFARVGIYLHI